MESGQSLTHYVVQEKIGQGGMGEVWLAQDTRLDREVAIKILPPAFADDEERLTRFEREAKALAKLNHPHIAQIFGVDQVDHVCFLVLELVAGETLADRIDEGPLPVEEALNLCRQIAEGLEAAHDMGIVHRDLKPANVRITPEGVVKVLDFGLAKSSAKDPETGVTLPLESDSLALTSEGHVLGTPTYMSPEQARGKRTDRRTDIWAFGCVLFEMLSGQRAFSGETVTDVLGAIVHKEPEWSLLPERTPTRVRELLRRCLSKDAHNRLRDIGDARVELEEILADPTATMAIAPVPEARPVRRTRQILLLLLVASGAIGATYGVLRSLEPEPPVRRFRLQAKDVQLGPVTPHRISPDGTSVLYRAGQDLWIRDLDTLEPRKLPGSEDAEHATWSPDGRSVAFAAEGKLWRLPVDGGPRAAITALPQSLHPVGGVAWQDDGTVVWVSGREGEPLLQVSAGGGDPKVLLEVSKERGEADLHAPAALPGSKGLLCTLHRVGEGDADTLCVLPAGATEMRPLLTVEGDDSIYGPCYAPSGHVLYRRNGSNPGIWALPFSLDDLSATGEPFLAVPDGHQPSVSDDGTLLYSSSGMSGEFQLVWIDRQGRLDAEIGEPIEGQPWGAGLSPDGTRVSVVIREADATTLWCYDAERGTRTRLLLQQEGFAWVGAWMPDGQQVLVATGDWPDIETVMLAVDGSGTSRPIIRGDAPVDVTPDGTAMIVERATDADNFFIVPFDDQGEELGFLEGAGDKDGAQLSPDGRHAVYWSDESGHDEVYVTRFPSGQGKWLVYEDEGRSPFWSPLGDEIFFTSDGKLFAAPVSTEGALSIGPAEMLFGSDGTGINFFRGVSVAPDAQRFMVVRSNDRRGDESGIVLVENWAAEFADR